LDIKTHILKWFSFLSEHHLLFIKSCMHQQIKNTQHALVQGVRCLTITAHFRNLGDHLITHGFSGFIMFAQSLGHVGIPDPVFKHLRWHFNEVTFDLGTRHRSEITFGTQVVHHVTKFMEKGDDVIVR
jgi:hypothetical protein